MDSAGSNINDRYGSILRTRTAGHVRCNRVALVVTTRKTTSSLRVAGVFHFSINRAARVETRISHDQLPPVMSRRGT
jgi:hypothetical protein